MVNLQAVGDEVRSACVEEIGTTFSKGGYVQRFWSPTSWAGALEVDGMHFFPCMKWFTSRSQES